VRLLRTFAVDPVGVSRALPGELRQARANMGVRSDEADRAWQEHLHGLLGAAWPCPEGQRVDELMVEVGALLSARGWGFGRDNTYGWYADADSSLCRAAWCTVVHTRPEVVIETGVAHGVTSRIVLEAMRQNNYGHLWSIDLPFPFDHRLHAETGAAITDACRPRWSYLEGSSRQRLPSLVADVGHVEMFIHDSLHTARNTLFEMEQAAAKMSRGGVMLVDDISMHAGFAAFARRHPGYRTVTCAHADRSSMFGIAVNA
jgi:Methyltransferase domain